MCCMCATQEGVSVKRAKQNLGPFDKLVSLLLPFLSVPSVFHLLLPLRHSLLLFLSYI